MAKSKQQNPDSKVAPDQEKSAPPPDAPQTKQSDQKKAPQTGKNPLEWTVFALSSALVATMFGWLIFQELRGSSGPPRLEITLGAPVKAGKRLLIPVEVENRGGTTASGVEVEVARENGKETATFVLPHVPRNASRQGWVLFDAPVQTEDLDAKILGYEVL